MFQVLGQVTRPFTFLEDKDENSSTESMGETNT